VRWSIVVLSVISLTHLHLQCRSVCPYFPSGVWCLLRLFTSVSVASLLLMLCSICPCVECPYRPFPFISIRNFILWCSLSWSGYHSCGSSLYFVLCMVSFLGGWVSQFCTTSSVDHPSILFYSCLSFYMPSVWVTVLCVLCFACLIIFMSYVLLTTVIGLYPFSGPI
jgi:hypothetical protein